MNKITKSFLMLLLTLVGVVSAQAQGWYSADKFTAKDYEGFTEELVVGEDGNHIPFKNWWESEPQKYKDGSTKYEKTSPDISAARFVEAEGYIEVKSNDLPLNPHDCQFWMEVPEDLRANGTKVEVSMKAWASADITVQPQIHNAPGGYLDNSNPKATFKKEQWVDLKYTFTVNKDDFKNYCFNLSDTEGEKAITYRFKDIQFAAAKPDWYYATEFHAKDYHNADATYSNDATTQKLFPEPPFVADEDGGYVEVISNKKDGQNTWGSQIFIKIPDEYVGKSTKLTMKVKASEAVAGAGSSFHFTASGAGWGDNADASAKPAVPFTTEWKDITCILNTKGVTCAGELDKALFPERQQANYFVLDLSQSTENAITYMFKDVVFDKAAEDWYLNNKITVAGEDAPYIYGTGEEGGYVEVAGGKSLSIEIPESFRGAEVEIFMTVKASAAAESGDGVKFTTEWAETSAVFDATEEGATTYVMNLPEGATFDFDEISFKKYFAPVDFGDLVEVPVEGTLVKEVDFTTLAPSAFNPYFNVAKDGYTKEVVAGLGLEIVNTTKMGRWDPQFAIIQDFPLEAERDYAVRYTLKYQGDGGVGDDGLQTNFGLKNWSNRYDKVVDFPAGPIYTQIVINFPEYDATGDGGVFFQSGAIVGRTIVEKVEVFDVTPDYAGMDWSENILENGDLSTEDMDEFIVKNNDVEDPEMLPAKRTEFEGAYEIDVETSARPTKEDETLGGSDTDAQFFVRLPYVLPKGTLFNLEFDLYAEQVNTLAIVAHGEPGDLKGNLGSVKTDPSVDAVHYQKYLKAPEEMRTIAVNLAVATDATYAFSNFNVQVLDDDEATIKAATEAADATTLWAETLALNIACNEGRNTETEGKGYDEALVKDLTDAVAAGKDELKKADATKESLAAATKKIEDAIAALKAAAPEEYLPAPDTDPDYADFVEIAQAQEEPADSGNPLANIEQIDANGVPATKYTTQAGICVVLKMKEVDVKDCDYITIKLAQPAPAGLSWSVWTNNKSMSIKEGDTEIKYEFDGEYEHACEISEDGIIPEISIIGIFCPADIKLSVYGVYKHKIGEADAIEEVAEDAALKDGKYFIDGQIVIVKNGVKYNAAGVAIQ